MAPRIRNVSLPEAVARLRADLQLAEATADDRTRFSVEEIRLTLEVEAEQTDAVEGGVRWYVVAASGRRQWRWRRTNRVELLLKPVGPIEVGKQREHRPDGAVTERP